MTHSVLCTLVISQNADTFHYFDRLSMGSLFVRLVPLLLRLSLLVVLPTWARGWPSRKVYLRLSE